MIGFYDYTVIMTYISVVSSMIGIFCAVTDHISAAVCCLAFSGLCDMFDGKIARTKKNRTEEEKCFGIQIDSLADIVCFGILPIVLGFKLGMCHIYGIAILLFYGLAGLIRLAYFNVMEEKRQNETSENRKYYQGLPITSMSVVLPLLFVVSLLFPEYKWFVVLLHIAMLTVGLLFILDFKFRKPTNRELVIIVADLEVPEMQAIAKAHGVHPALIALKWAHQRGEISIPFSVHNYASNLKCVTEDPLTEKEMATIATLEKGNRLVKGQVFLWHGARDWHDLWDEDGVIVK